MGRNDREGDDPAKPGALTPALSCREAHGLVLWASRQGALFGPLALPRFEVVRIAPVRVLSDLDRLSARGVGLFDRGAARRLDRL